MKLYKKMMNLMKNQFKNKKLYKNLISGYALLVHLKIKMMLSNVKFVRQISHKKPLSNRFKKILNKKIMRI